MSTPKFPLGRVVFTRKALDHLTPQDVVHGLERHGAGDWGEVDEAAKRMNEMAVSLNLRVASKYQAAEGVAFWIFTLADRSVTTVLLPEDY
jgi:hypothetical protein